MLLKNRLQIYSWTGNKVNYFNPREDTTDIKVKYRDHQNREHWLELPKFVETPRDIEMYVAGIERIYNYDFERRNYLV